jgi:uncharacterized protein (TIGR02466 family)
MVLKSLFVTEIQRSRLGSESAIRRLNLDLKKDIDAMMSIDNEGWEWSEKNYVGGYTSYASLTKIHERFAPFVALRKHIDKQVRAYVRSLEWDLQGHDLRMTSCWVNVMPPMVQHSLHLHPLAVVSGTYYVVTPKGSGDLRFEDPRLGLFMGTPPRRDQAHLRHQPFYRLSPKDGDLILWESWLRHEVSANRAKSERISISFNYEWR